MILLRLGSVAPARLSGKTWGLFQVLSTLGLTLFGVPAGHGAPVHADSMGHGQPCRLLIVGFVALVATGARMGEIHSARPRASMRARQGRIGPPPSGNAGKPHKLPKKPSSRPIRNWGRTTEPVS